MSIKNNKNIITLIAALPSFQVFSSQFGARVSAILKRIGISFNSKYIKPMGNAFGLGVLPFLEYQLVFDSSYSFNFLEFHMFSLPLLLNSKIDQNTLIETISAFIIEYLEIFELIFFISLVLSLIFFII